MFGRESEFFAAPFVAAMFIRLTNTAEASRSTEGRGPVGDDGHTIEPFSPSQPGRA